MNRELLEMPFQPDQIKQREGSFGRTLDYVEGHAIIQRLNDAFDSCWSFEIVKYEITESKDEVIVIGKLVVENVVKMQFGSSKITRLKGTGEILSLADDLKASATDSLKKCATLLGIGLHLYKGPVLQEKSGSMELPKGPGVDGNNNGGNGKPKGNGRVTNNQLNFLVTLGKSLRLDSKDLDKMSIEKFGVKLANLSSKDGSALIDNLRRQVADGNTFQQ